LKIGILGSGSVGRALGKGFASKGHDVKLGSRTPAKQELQDWLKEAKGKSSVGTFSETAAHG
jgi:predicted dinucleotide-binding enzyme